MRLQIWTHVSRDLPCNVPQANPATLFAACLGGYGAIEEGEWPPNFDAALHATMVRATIHGLMATWHLAPGSFSWDAAAAALAAR